MDGNRTHPGRLNSAPQTVLKTAFLTSAAVRRRPPPIKPAHHASADVHQRALRCAKLAVILAVRGLTRGPGDNRLGDETRTLKLAVSSSLGWPASPGSRRPKPWAPRSPTTGLRFRWVPRESGAKPELSRNCEWGAPVQ